MNDLLFNIGKNRCCSFVELRPSFFFPFQSQMKLVHIVALMPL